MNDMRGADALLIFADGTEKHMMLPYPLHRFINYPREMPPRLTPPTLRELYWPRPEDMFVTEIVLYRTPDSPDEAPVYRESI